MQTLLLLVSLATGPGIQTPSAPSWGDSWGGAALHHDDPTIQLALGVVGQPLAAIEVIDFEEAQQIYRQTPGARALTSDLADALHAFRVAADGRIFVNRSSPVYAAAERKPTTLGVLKLAAILAHEQVHGTDGEYAASRLQADFVRSRLKGLPRREKVDGSTYLRDLEARATALGRGARRAAAASTAARRPDGFSAPANPPADPGR